MEYRIIYSSRRTLAIQITKACEVVVRAPRGISREKIDAFVKKSEAWILKHLEIQKSRRETKPELKAELEALKQRALLILPQRVEYFSRLMGVSPSSVSINRAKTRFGSCSSKGRINFSCRLMQYPDEAIDYVIIHELAHLKHLNHSKEFWAFVERFCPDYKARKGLLK
ncbi:MAG: M48 family metallopeptidase [Clostridia bacterium]|nr:M48 family metallopeptidase [Clostridia bacterium]